MILTQISLMSVSVSDIIGRILNLSRTYCVTRMSYGLLVRSMTEPSFSNHRETEGGLWGSAVSL